MSCSWDRWSCQSRLRTIRTVAALELPPPSPPPMGMVLCSQMSAPSGVVWASLVFRLPWVAWRRAWAARTVRSWAGGTLGVGVWRMIWWSRRGAMARVSARLIRVKILSMSW